MSAEYLQRTQKLVGDKINKLIDSSVLIVGLGGVGGCVFEMLARAGVGRLTVVDCDDFDITNLNRQILCTLKNIGKPKTNAAEARAKEIAPHCKIIKKYMRYTGQNDGLIFDTHFDYVADCIDSVTDKTDLILSCINRNIPVISAMGAGNRLTPQFKITDIYSTEYDGLARAVRKRLRAAGVKSLNVVCDSGIPQNVDGIPGTISYAPNASGCVMAQKIVTDLLCKE